MKHRKASILLLAGIIVFTSCTQKPAASSGTEPLATAPAPGAQASSAPSPQAPVPTAAGSQPSPASAPAPAVVKPPEPKKYVLSAGTPISVRTLSDVNTKSIPTGSEFETTLENALTVDGHTLAKRGATVVAKVLSADQGGRVKGKASLTVTLVSVHLANGKTVAISSNSVTQEAKSGTKKNLTRTGIATGAGAAIGAIAGGGKGAAIGAGIGAGAGVATNLATRGPAADIPPETVLNFSLRSDLVVVENP